MVHNGFVPQGLNPKFATASPPASLCFARQAKRRPAKTQQGLAPPLLLRRKADDYNQLSRQAQAGPSRQLAHRLHQGNVLGHRHFFGTTLHIKIARKTALLQPFAQGIAQNFAALAKGHLHQFF